MRTRPTVLQAQTHQWLATFGNPGNGEYRAELRRAVAAIQSDLQVHHHPEARAILPIRAQDGTRAVLPDLAGLASVMRGKDYQIVKRPEIQARLKLPPDQQMTHPESGMTRSLSDCPGLALGPEGALCRVVGATHPAGTVNSRIGVTRAGVVDELFRPLSLRKLSCISNGTQKGRSGEKVFLSTVFKLALVAILLRNMSMNGPLRSRMSLLS